MTAKTLSTNLPLLLPKSHHRFPHEPPPAKLLGALLWMVVLPLLCAFNSAQAQIFGGATKIISGDYAPARSSMATDDFGDIYIAYDVLVSRTPTASGVISVHEIRVARSTDGGSTFTSKVVARGQTRLPSLAVSSAGTLFLSYLRGENCSSAQDCLERPAAERAAIMVTSSTDGGETFLPAIQVSTPFVTEVDEESNIAVDSSGKVYVLWSEADSTDGAAKGAYSPNMIRMRTSTDQAKTFSPPILIRGDPGYNLGEQFIPGNLTSAKIAVTWDEQIHITWLQCATDYCFELFYSRSMDGQAFSAPLLVDDRVDIYSVGNQGIAVDFSGDVSVVYTRDDSGFDLRSNVYHCRIKEGVVTSRSNISNVPSEFQAYQPAVAMDDLGRIYVAWTSTLPGAASRTEPNEILMRRSSDGGRSFSAVANISNSARSAENPGAYSPTLAIGLANTPLIAWGDNQPFCSVDCFSYPGELRFRRGSDQVHVMDPRGALDVDDQGNLLGDVDSAISLRDNYRSNERGGVVADGVSKLLVIVRSASSLTFALKSTDELPRGTLAAFGQANAGGTFAVVPAVTANNGESVVVAVYTPPDSFGTIVGAQRYVTIEIRPSDSPDRGSVSVALTIERPPIIFVPDLWGHTQDSGSSPEMLKFAARLSGGGFPAFYAGYGGAEHQTFDPAIFDIQEGGNSPAAFLQRRITELVEEYSDKSVAMSQVDVVGHGMGGLIARSFVQQDHPYYRHKSANYNRGFIHRLITIGTPHFGSPLAKILFENRNVEVALPEGPPTTLADHFRSLGQPLDSGALEALMPGSVAFSRLTETTVTSKSLGGSWNGGAEGSATNSYAALESFLQVALRDSTVKLEGLFGGTLHDLFASDISQHGNDVGTTFSPVIHSKLPPGTAVGDTSELEDEEIRTRVIDLLSTPDLTRFTKGFSAPLPPVGILSAKAYPRLDEQNAFATAAPKALRITSVAGGEALYHDPNTFVSITAEAMGGASLQKLVFLVQGIGTFVAPSAPPYTISFNVPNHAPLGKLNVQALALDVSGVLLGDSTNIVLTQHPTAGLRHIQIEPRELVLKIASSRQLSVLGEFLNSSQAFVSKIITSGSLGTTYSARAGTNIVTVTADGLVSARNEGVDTVEIRFTNSSRVARVAVKVVGENTPMPTPDPTPRPTPSEWYTISGHVTGEIGSPLGNVTITLQSGTETRTVQSDSTGSYSFGNLPGGAAYRVTASKFRYLFAPARQGFDTLTTNQTVDFTALQGNSRGAINGKIAFASTRDSIGNAINFEIYVGNPDGTNQTRLTYSLGQDLQPAWSPDGKKIAFSSQRDGNAEIYVMNADGSGVTRLTDDSSSDTTPAWSPNGRQIAFASSREGSGAIYVMDADGGNVRRLTTNSDSDSSPTWSPNGATLAFESRRDGNTEIYTINTDGSSLIKLTDNEAREQQPSWSPDGAKIVFSSNRDGNNEIYVMDADGANPVRLTDHLGLDWYPGWSPDGTKIIFDSTRDGANDIYTVTPAGGSVTRVTDQPPYNTNADWQALAPPPPTILSFSPQSGLPGSTVTIFGANLTEALTVQFNGVTSRFAFDSTELIATIPLGATTGPITVASATGTNITAGNFMVLLDADNDGMSDGFEQQHFGGAQAADPAEDSDGDGATNLQEYRAGTNPADSQSVFRITDVRREGNEIVVVFPGLTSKRYELEASGDLADGFHDVVTKTPQMTGDTLVELRVLRRSYQPFLFFRVVAMP